jgi:hypothetical protein
MNRREFVVIASTISLSTISGCATVEEVLGMGSLEIAKVFLTGGEEHGDILWVNLTLKNTGQATRSGTVVATIDDTEVGQSSVSVTGRGAAGIQFKVETESFSPGTYDLTIEAGDDSYDILVNIPE